MCELALDIDPGQEGGREYPYAPMTGNLMYCMPREQTRAYLRLGGSSEGRKRTGTWDLRRKKY